MALEEAGKPRRGERALRPALQFRAHAWDAADDAGNGRRHLNHIWSVEEIVGLLDTRSAVAA